MIDPRDRADWLREATSMGGTLAQWRRRVLNLLEEVERLERAAKRVADAPPDVTNAVRTPRAVEKELARVEAALAVSRLEVRELKRQLEGPKAPRGGNVSWREKAEEKAFAQAARIAELERELQHARRHASMHSERAASLGAQLAVALDELERAKGAPTAAGF